MIPPTHHAKVTRWSRADPGVFTVIMRALTPNRFVGQQREVEQLLRDLACLGGVPWEWYGAGAKAAGIRGEELTLPYQLLSGHTGDPAEGAVAQAIDELVADYIVLAEKLEAVGGELELQQAAEARKQAELLGAVPAAAIGEHPLTPECRSSLIPELGMPARLWLFREVRFQVQPAPSAELMEWRAKEWWFSWA